MPVITCPANINVNNDLNQCGAIVNYPQPATSTGLPDPTITYSPVSGSFFPVGTTSVTATATNSAGSDMCTFDVVVIDNQLPTISCPSNISVRAFGPSGTIVNYTAPVGTDNCSNPVTVRTLGLASGSTFPIGVSTVTHTVTDASGNNAALCSFTVTVGTIAPVITCPSNINVNTDANQCGAVVNYSTPATATGAPVPTITYSPASGSFFPVGTTTVTATATNAAGSDMCTFDVTVTDNFNFTCPSDITRKVCNLFVNIPLQTSTPCGPIISTVIPGYTYIGTFNGSFYYSSNAVSTWGVANTNAIAQGGHLVTISSAAESIYFSKCSCGFLLHWYK